MRIRGLQGSRKIIWPSDRHLNQFRCLQPIHTPKSSAVFGRAENASSARFGRRMHALLAHVEQAMTAFVVEAF
jgi:hypothetical protein